MTARFFVDTNVAIYALDVDEPKRQRALAVMQSSPVVSTQVVNEFLNVLLVKRKIDRPGANQLARALMQGCEVVPITPEMVELAMQLGERHQVGHWDSLIIAAALVAGCETLYSEDLQDGQVFEDRLTVRNPFTGL